MENNAVELIIKTFKDGDDIRDAGLVTPENILRYDDIQYAENEKWNVLDVYHLKGIDKPSPTIVSIHGGGWVYGDKERYQHYCMDLALRGFTVVNFTYRLAPEYTFPCALEDINSVFNWIAENGENYNIDKNKIFVVGDSAGGQLGSQYLALFTNENYQKLFNFSVPCGKISILASALNCGVYDVINYVTNSSDDIINVYMNKNDESQLNQMDTVGNITEEFPPCYIMTSYHDFLRQEAEPFYNLLKSKNVECQYHLFGEKQDSHMTHVFHLNIRLKEAKVCNDDECNFFKEILKR